MPSSYFSSPSSLSVEAARHICQEARVVLTSLRGGPPNVARGDLAQDLMDLRTNFYGSLDYATTATTTTTTTTTPDQKQQEEPTAPPEQQQQQQEQEKQQQTSTTATTTFNNNHDNDVGPFARPFLAVIVDPRAAGPHTLVALRSLFRLLERGSLLPIIKSTTSSLSTTNTTTTTTTTTITTTTTYPHPYTVSLEPLTKGVLSCKFEQTDAGADEAVEMAIADLLALLIQMDHNYNLKQATMTTTTAKTTTATSSTSTGEGKEEEPTSSSSSSSSSATTSSSLPASATTSTYTISSIQPETLFDAFNTIFVTRNTFVHSPALCYHFEDVLTSIVTCVFTTTSTTLAASTIPKRQMILEFLVNQLLHTPMVAGGNTSTSISSNNSNTNSGNSSGSLVGDYMVGGGADDSREAYLAHDATRLLCLRLINVALKFGWCNNNSNDNDNNRRREQQHIIYHDPALIRIIQDDLCLSLLMTGQAVWAAYQHDDNIMKASTGADGSTNNAAAAAAAAAAAVHAHAASVGDRSSGLLSSSSGTTTANIISLEVLSEICNTISTLWNTLLLRPYLVAQFETIFTGFYQRALVLLRKRFNPIDSLSFNTNLIFDSQIEIIVESLIDILCLHDFTHNIAKEYGNDGGALECLFMTYDCHMKRSDVGTGLFLELCRCCGGTVSEEGHNVLLLSSSNSSSSLLSGSGGMNDNNNNNNNTATAAATKKAAGAAAGITSLPAGSNNNESSSRAAAATSSKPQNNKSSNAVDRVDSGVDSTDENIDELLSSYHYNDDSFHSPPLSSSGERPPQATDVAPELEYGTESNDDEYYDDDEEEETSTPISFYRQVPPHLKELCAQAIIGGMKCLVKDDHPSEETLKERSKRSNTIMLPPKKLQEDEQAQQKHEKQKQEKQQEQQRMQQKEKHVLRNIKSKKQLMRQAAILFNQKSSKGIEFLVSTGLVSSLSPLESKKQSQQEQNNDINNNNDGTQQGHDNNNNEDNANDPPVITPFIIASFLRDGIVVGLDKGAVGAYLGEAGKPPAPGKSYHIWDRDWFHKEVLQAYCTLFNFENQSLLDSQRMFLAAFRLPGEAQQIDRILQAFADTCSQVCEEQCNRSHAKLFSNDPKKASDTAYLLSFSIIMLTTDLHNDNIRSDRKMKLEDFIRNNTNYGRDITDPGKELPPEYLKSIYDSIREEEIRTEGEGAGGCMTIERWKDVLRSSDGGSFRINKNKVDNNGNEQQQGEGNELIPTVSVIDAEDLTELILEQVWIPIMAAIGALWGVRSLPMMLRPTSGTTANSSSSRGRRSSKARRRREKEIINNQNYSSSSQIGMLGAQGARLGMDMALEMLQGVRQLGRIDIFRKIFACVCCYTGLNSDSGGTMEVSSHVKIKKSVATENRVEKTWSFTNSVEAQSAVIVAMRTARDYSDEIGVDGWKLVLSILFELRDLRLLGRYNGSASSNSSSGASDVDSNNDIGGSVATTSNSDSSGQHILKESEADFLTEDARRDWNMWLLKGDVDYNKPKKPKRPSSVLGAFGRALFGGGDEEDLGDDYYYSSNNGQQYDQSKGKSDHPSLLHTTDMMLWDEIAPSDDEENDRNNKTGRRASLTNKDHHHHVLSAGGNFEIDLIQENLLISQRTEMPVTGLESVEDVYNRQIQLSPRARVRNRLARACDFHNGLICESRFMGVDGIQCMIQALSDMIKANSQQQQQGIPLSPASVAFAEVLICEIVTKNKDRLATLWRRTLQSHYVTRLSGITERKFTNSTALRETLIHSGLEKCVTGLLRICACAVQKEEIIGNEILSAWKELIPININDDRKEIDINDSSSSNSNNYDTTLLGILGKHVGEGLWRIVRNVDGLSHLQPDGWEGLVTVVNWCAKQGAGITGRSGHGTSAAAMTKTVTKLDEDDSALQAYRSIHLMFNTEEVQHHVPYNIIESIKALIYAGQDRNYSQLSIAGLDLLHTLLGQRGALAVALLLQQKGNSVNHHDNNKNNKLVKEFWEHCWRPVVETMATVAETGKNSSVRQHALSILTDTFLEQRGNYVPIHHLFGVLSEVCVPRTGRRLLDLRLFGGGNQTHGIVSSSGDEVMIEFELCIGLLFKPLRHHLKRAVEGSVVSGNNSLLSLWKSILMVLEELLRDEERQQLQKQRKDPSVNRFAMSVELAQTMDELASEHLKNAIMVLITVGLLTDEDARSTDDNISFVTWEYVGRMGFCKSFIDEWKQAAAGKIQVDCDQGEW